jgi:RimJ/RimL family protein N-acetyltransferase
MMLNEGRLVRLRALERTDLPACVKWFADPEVRANLLVDKPMSLAEEERWFEGLAKRPDDVIFAVETLSGKHIGNVGLHKIDRKNRNAEAGIVIGDKRFWGKGYGTDAMKLLLRYAFEDLNMHKVYLLHFAGNERARRSYEKCGFVKEGVLRDHVYKGGKYHDHPIMSVINPAERGKRPLRRNA